MEHKLITGGEQFLPFARSRIKAMQATGLSYASQKFEVEGVSIDVRTTPGHEYISLSGSEGVGLRIWANLPTDLSKRTIVPHPAVGATGFFTIEPSGALVSEIISPDGLSACVRASNGTNKMGSISYVKLIKGVTTEVLNIPNVPDGDIGEFNIAERTIGTTCSRLVSLVHAQTGVDYGINYGKCTVVWLIKDSDGNYKKQEADFQKNNGTINDKSFLAIANSVSVPFITTINSNTEPILGYSARDPILIGVHFDGTWGAFGTPWPTMRGVQTRTTITQAGPIIDGACDLLISKEYFAWYRGAHVYEQDFSRPYPGTDYAAVRSGHLKVTYQGSPTIVSTKGDTYAIYYEEEVNGGTTDLWLSVDGSGVTSYGERYDSFTRKRLVIAYGGNKFDIKTVIVEDVEGITGGVGGTQIVGAAVVPKYISILAPFSSSGGCRIYVLKSTYNGARYDKVLKLYKYGKQTSESILFSAFKLVTDTSWTVSFAIDPSFSLQAIDRVFPDGSLSYAGFSDGNISVGISALKFDPFTVLLTHKAATPNTSEANTLALIDNTYHAAFIKNNKLYCEMKDYKVNTFSLTETIIEGGIYKAKQLGTYTPATPGLLVDTSTKK